MPISMNKYVNITSAVAGVQQVPRRQFVGRVFTNSLLLDPHLPKKSFLDAASVGAYFGIASEEYARAVQYFSYISASARTPQEIQFAPYSDVARHGVVYGGNLSGLTLAQLQAITAGNLSFNGLSSNPFDLSTATDFTSAAAIITAGFVGSEILNILCTWDAINQRFVVTNTNTANVACTMTADTFGGVGATLKLTASTCFVEYSGSDAQTPVQAFIASESADNNFGSFCFTNSSVVSQSQSSAVSAFNSTLNLMYSYQETVTSSNYGAYFSDVGANAGTVLNLVDPNGAYIEMLPMAIQAATDFGQRNGIQDYNYKQLSVLNASVTSDAIAAIYDANKVNYYGQTQTAGKQISFYQPGVMCGGATAPQTQNIYANEAWLKDYVGAAILSQQLAMPQWSAGAAGKGMLLSILQSAITAANFNGVITTGKSLNITQQLAITSLTGDANAWLQVQNKGSYVMAAIVSSVDPVSGLTVYTAQYTLIYSKNDAVRNVVGAHVLI